MPTLAFLTPDDAPEPYTCKALRYPNSEAWQALVAGALLLLADEENWEQTGTLTPAQCAAVGLEIYSRFVGEGSCGMPVGAIALWAGGAAPDGWLLCDGSGYQPSLYPDLFATIGYTWGQVEDLFLVPQLNGRFPRGGVDDMTQTGGEETHTLTVAEMPQHTHTQNPHSHGYFMPANVPIPAGPLAPVPSAYPVSSNTSPQTAVNQNTGSGDAHNNLPPYVVLKFIIRAR